MENASVSVRSSGFLHATGNFAQSLRFGSHLRSDSRRALVTQLPCARLQLPRPAQQVSPQLEQRECGAARGSVGRCGHSSTLPHGKAANQCPMGNWRPRLPVDPWRGQGTGHTAEEVGVRQGFVLWFTGYSGAGKSTIAGKVVSQLAQRGVDIELLDGDEVRTHLSKGLGFNKEDRDINVRRIAWVAGLLSRHGVCAVTAAISPYADVRAEARAMADVFIEVFVDAPLEECRQRDVKGLYARADRGEIPNFTGVSDPYEPPENPEVHVHTDQQTPEESAQAVVRYLEERELVPVAP